MKIINLTLTAFGPFKEKQLIDFTRLGDESIFLITGPTGAGKTTIFDAICYGLYGKASGSDRDHDSLRSDFAATDEETEVELLFELKQTTYLIKRKPKQSRPKSRGEGLVDVPATATLYQVTNDEEILMSSRIKDVNETIEQLIGLDYDQFLKMIMIPQGEFRKLISENSYDREKILQKIFRTHIYQSITNNLQVQAKEMKSQLQKIQDSVIDQLSYVEWDQAEEIRETWTIEESISHLELLMNQFEVTNQEADKDYQKKRAIYTKAQTHLREQTQLANEFDQLVNENETKEKLELQADEINQLRQTFKVAEQAAKIELYEEQLVSRANEAEIEVGKLAKLEQELKHEQERLRVREQSFNRLKGDHAEKVKELEVMKEEALKTQSWAKLIEVEQKIKADQQTYQDLANQLKANKDKVKELRDKIKEVNEQLDRRLEQREESLKLNHEYTLLKEQLSKAEKLEQGFVELKRLEKLTNEIDSSHQKLEQQLTEQKNELAEFENEQQRHLASHLATHLITGESCPVCGSLEHPAPAKAIEGSHNDQEKEGLVNEITKLEQDVKQSQDQWIEQRSAYSLKQQAMIELAQLFNLESHQLSKEVIHNVLIQSKEQVFKQKQLIEQIEQEIENSKQLQVDRETMTTKVEQLEQTIEQRTSALNQIEQHLSRQAGEMSSHKQNCPKTNLTFDEWQQQQLVKQEALDSWFKSFTKQEAEFTQLNDSVSKLLTRYEAQQEFTNQLKEKLAIAEQTFEQELTKIGFPDHNAYLLAKRTVEEREQLHQQIKQYDNLLNQVSAQIKKLTDKLSNKQKPDLIHLQAELDKIQTDYENQIRYLEQLKEKHTKHATIFEQVANLRASFSELDQDYRDMSALADMANGDNHLKLSFERYVLSAFLEEILYQANLRLNTLTDHRYELKISDQLAKHGAKSGLDLEVFDQHTGKQRSVKTLSGGEGFQTSLCLALGMADVVQAYAGGVQLDTLFIDEGFGTLDDVSLEQAVNTLKGLQQSNRVLGIISHVNQLKEEIHAKLEINSTPQGSTARFNI